MHTELSPDRIYVTVDILILAVEEGKLHLMLSRRTAPPYAGRWALPGPGWAPRSPQRSRRP